MIVFLNFLKQIPKLWAVPVHRFFLLTFMIFIQSLGGYCAEKKKVIGLATFVTHSALQAVEKGILYGLKQEGIIGGKNVKIISENAHGNVATAVQIAQKFAGSDLDLIIAIATPVAQSMASATRFTKTKIVFAAVTDPVAARLVKSLENPGGHITGTTDFPPIASQIGLLLALQPQTKVIGVIFNPGEVNAQKQVEDLAVIAERKNIKVIAAPVVKITEVLSAAQRLIPHVDAIYVPQDNTVIPSLPSIADLALLNRTILIAPDPEGVKVGALATVGFSHFQEGVLAGTMAAQILLGKKSPSEIPVQSPSQKKIYLNLETALVLGIDIPEKILINAVKIIP